MHFEDSHDAAPLHLDPNVGALNQIVDQYKPADTPVIITDVVRDIDTIAKQVTYSGWLKLSFH